MEVADTMIDTLSTARRLEHEFGMDPRAAEGVATAIYENTADHLVTKANLQLAVTELRQEIKATADGLKENRTATDALRQEIKDTANGLRAEMRQMETALRAYTDGAFAGLRAEMHAEFKSLYRHLWLMLAGFAGLIVTLTKLLP